MFTHQQLSHRKRLDLAHERPRTGSSRGVRIYGEKIHSCLMFHASAISGILTTEIAVNVSFETTLGCPLLSSESMIDPGLDDFELRESL